MHSATTNHLSASPGVFADLLEPPSTSKSQTYYVKDTEMNQILKKSYAQWIPCKNQILSTKVYDLPLFTTYFSLLYQGLSWRGSIGSWEPINSQKSWENLENRPWFSKFQLLFGFSNFLEWKSKVVTLKICFFKMVSVFWLKHIWPCLATSTLFHTASQIKIHPLIT